MPPQHRRRPAPQRPQSPTEWDGISDAVLIAHIARGERAAFTEAYDRHAGSVYSLARAVGGPQAAEEITRQVFLALWRHPNNLDPDYSDTARDSLRARLLIVGHRRAVERVRREHADAAPTGSVGEREKQVLDRVGGQSRSLLARLTPLERQGIVLTYFGGYRRDQVGALLGDPEGQVITRIRSGLQSLYAPAGAASGTSATEQAGEEDADLRDSVTGLSRLVGEQLSLAGMLSHVADFAVRAVPGADGAGLTLFQQDRADTVVATAEFVRQVDAIQYGIGEGPCITAAAEARTVSSGSLEGDAAWPGFGRRVARLGVHSALSLPLSAPDGRVVGALNLYAHVSNAFGERATELAELFAVPAAIAVHTARELSQARRVSAQLQRVLSSRAVIDYAVGIVMSRDGSTSDEAFHKLEAISQGEGRTLSVVAQRLLDESVHRARACTPATDATN